MKPITKKWRMRDGTEIRICDMEDRHLLNTIRFLERNTEKARLQTINEGEAMLCILQGEAAIDSVECGLAQLESEAMDTEDFFPTYPYLLKEAKRRKLEA